jgi:glycerol kinase
VLLNTGNRPVASTNKLLTTVAYRLAGRVSYALEGSIFAAGATVQWLREGLGIIDDTAQSEALASTANPRSTVYLVPAFTGLGAPYWDADARGALFGLTRDSGRAEVVRAALEAVGYQTRDLIDAMAADGAAAPSALRVDGGLSANGWAMQFLADILDIPVERAQTRESTALGAAMLAGMQAGLMPGLAELAQRWQCDRRFAPAMPAETRARRLAGWHDAVRRTRIQDDGAP